MVMQDRKDATVRIYKNSYILPVTGKFIKTAYRGLVLKGNKMTVEDPKALAEDVVNFNSDKKILKTKLEKEFKGEYDTIVNEIIEIQNEARDRGWIVLC